MKWQDKGYKTPMARVTGLGSAKDGVGHWMHQRLTAIANAFLVLWLIWSICTHDFTDYAVFTGWLAEPLNAVMMTLLIISTFYHATLGSQVIVEDYLHHEGLKILKLVGQRLFFFALAVACIFSVLKLAFTG